MTRRFNVLSVLALTLLFSVVAFAQPNLNDEKETTYPSFTKDPKAKSPYPPKPKDMWEVGIHGGLLAVGGDVIPERPFPGYGLGIHVRKSLSYSWSLRGDLVFGNAQGRNTFTGAGLTLANPAYTAAGYGSGNAAVISHETQYTSFSIQALVSTNNLRFHRSANKLGFHFLFGFGLFDYSTTFDLKDAGGANYNFATALAGVTDASAARDALDNLMDGEYETDAPKKQNQNGEDVGIQLNVSVGAGISYRLGDRLSISLEPQLLYGGDDYLDGIHFRDVGVPTPSPDVMFYMPIRIGFFLGDSKKQSVPLYWVNPLDEPYKMIAANTKKVSADEMLVDGDNDGVPDLIDKERDSPAGAVVDTRGVTLDSDKDGLANHLDQEPYSPAGWKIDPQTGISEKPVMPKTLSEDDVKALAKQEKWYPQETSGSTNTISDWFLPMVHFDLDGRKVKSQYYPALAHVATVMKNYPSVRVVVEGHADATSSVRYNQGLSYDRAKNSIDFLVKNYGIDRSRLILRYSGETQPLVASSPNNYMNRRVEFRVSNGSETDMPAPQ